jgi:hypothetical protein
LQVFLCHPTGWFGRAKRFLSSLVSSFAGGFASSRQGSVFAQAGYTFTLLASTIPLLK